ncbi:mitochondrial-processing peptidase subunit alpha-like [Watersipora subatra]|uniref:mitochondrial-processing peptidase subunit alpha-like n=1 Tax=Watersipora subatra TaxID=2589382 RepID=UPI00355B3A2B
MSGKKITRLVSTAVAKRSATLRYYSSTNKINIDTPLSKPLPGISVVKGDTKFDSHSKTQVTKLSNGLTVASEDHWGQFATLGVLVNSGSRNEVAYLGGINHFLEKLAYSSTDKFQGKQEISTLLEKYGGICDCQSSRDTMIHAISLQKAGLDTAVEILSEVVLRPCFTEEEVEQSRQAIDFELETLSMNPNKEIQMMELIHAAAYRQNTLGLPKMCPPENLPIINRDLLFTYLKHQCTFDEMVIAGSGMHHEELVELAEKYFTRSPSWSNMQLDTQYRKDKSYAQYTGGLATVNEDLSNVSLGPTPMPELAHVCLAMESCSHQHEDFVAYCVLNALMGGGGSFSAGGPGKGMYTRLYKNVLNRHFWIENATAFNHSYADSGLFIFYGSAHPHRLADLTAVLSAEFKRMTEKIDKADLARAKRQLQSMLMMNLESRPIIFEDIGRQVLSSGHRKQPLYFYDAIERITESDVRNVATKLFNSPVSVSALGTLNMLPDSHVIKSMMNLDKPSLASRLLYNRR